jgi:hypothetical protein
MTEVIAALMGAGVISVLWKLNSKVAELVAEVRHIGVRFNDHEDRIRRLEDAA